MPSPEQDAVATPAYLDVTPPPWAVRGLAYLLIALAAVGALAAALITLPETVSSPFMLVPREGADPLRAPRGGVVAAVRVREGQTVSRGAPLFVIRSTALGDRAGELGALRAQLQGVAEAGRNAGQKHESQRRSDEEEAQRLARRAGRLAEKLAEHEAIRAVRRERFRADLEIQENTIDITLKEFEFKRTQHALTKELAERFERYHGEGAISWLDYKSRELEMTKLGAEVQQLERALGTARLRVNQLRAEHETWEKEWAAAAADLAAESREVGTAVEKLRQAGAARDAEQREVERRLAEEAARAEIRAAALQSDLRGSRDGELLVTAACDGTMVGTHIRSPGAVVQDGEVLGELACGGDRLQAEALVAQAGIGQVKPGQPVKLLYEAFPYQRHGAKWGTIRWVSPAGLPSGERSGFRVLIDLQDDAVMVKGEARRLLPGMGGRAEIVVGRRSLLSFAFDPIRQLKENFAPTP